MVRLDKTKIQSGLGRRSKEGAIALNSINHKTLIVN